MCEFAPRISVVASFGVSAAALGILMMIYFAQEFHILRYDYDDLQNQVCGIARICLPACVSLSSSLAPSPILVSSTGFVSYRADEAAGVRGFGARLVIAFGLKTRDTIW
eukprot:scaffold195602_cov52-Prasinocladus_malaysianus.AAC.1